MKNSTAEMLTDGPFMLSVISPSPLLRLAVQRLFRHSTDSKAFPFARKEYFLEDLTVKFLLSLMDDENWAIGKGTSTNYSPADFGVEILR